MHHLYSLGIVWSNNYVEAGIFFRRTMPFGSVDRGNGIARRLEPELWEMER